MITNLMKNINLIKAVILKLLPYVAKTLDMTDVVKDYEISAHG